MVHWSVKATTKIIIKLAQVPISGQQLSANPMVRKEKQSTQPVSSSAQFYRHRKSVVVFLTPLIPDLLPM